MKEKSKGLKESKKAPQLSLKEKRKLKKEKKNRDYGGQALNYDLSDLGISSIKKLARSN